MRHTLQLSFLAVTALTADVALADTLRCGSSLVRPGDSIGYVFEKCGEPASKMEVSEPVRGLNADGYSYVVGTITREIWRYTRRPGEFPAELTFEGGVLKKLEFDKSPS